MVTRAVPLVGQGSSPNTQCELEQQTAEEVLLDDQINDLWMRQVQKDPSRFLSVKFYMQLQRQDNDLPGEDKKAP